MRLLLDTSAYAAFMKKASEPLSKYAQKARKDPVIVVKEGRPFAAVVPITVVFLSTKPGHGSLPSFRFHL